MYKLTSIHYNIQTNTHQTTHFKKHNNKITCTHNPNPSTYITHSQIKLKTLQIIISLTYKCHHSITISLYMQFNTNINLQLLIQLKISSYTYHHTLSFLIQNTSYLNPSKFTYEHQTKPQNQKIFTSLTHQWDISLLIYLNIHFKPNIDL